MSPSREETRTGIAGADEARALAGALWRRAADLYASLAARMEELGNEPARLAFARIEADAREHAQAGGGADATAAPAIFEDEDLGASRLVTPYAAHALAVRNAERAFAFWAYAGAHVTDAAVRAETERLAQEAQGQLKALRRWRRQAYHATRADGSPTPPWQPPPREALRTASLAEFRGEAARREAMLGALHAQVARALAAEGHPAASVWERVSIEETDLAVELGGEPATVEPPSVGSEPSPDRRRGLATAHLEEAVEFYLTVAEHSGREEVVEAAQRLAEHGIDRLSRLG